MNYCPDYHTVLVKNLSEDAKCPTKNTYQSAGYDLYSQEDVLLEARKQSIVPTGISISVPVGTYARIAPRSGLAAKYMLDVGAGVVDSDYRGEVKVIMFNLSDTDYQVKKGDKIAQFIVEKYVMTDIQVVDTLDDTERGYNGFGSSGI